ncbi:hypothetical protein EV426DRAFT_236471 [Tirmania nivea]|nr:hypothetical protein EV426DRAFT_236471 [Tirmania nivea]
MLFEVISCFSMPLLATFLVTGIGGVFFFLPSSSGWGWVCFLKPHFGILYRYLIVYHILALITVLSRLFWCVIY